MKVHFQLTHVAAALALLASGSVLAHGYISQPESRPFLCKQGENTQCGQVTWEPQSVEGADGFPDSGPADGTIAGAGKPNWSQLNAQTSNRWAKREVSSGPFQIKWTFTAPHKTKDWRYYITKQDWNQNQPLSREAFELTPFCVVDGNMQPASAKPTHDCVLPERSGYQVILGVWDVGDTGASFYNVIDAQFKDGAQPPSPWSQNGSIVPSIDLAEGDKVKTRVFDANGERPDLQTTLTISNSSQGQKNQWAYELASKINKEQTQIRAGQKQADGQFVPVYGNNPVYLKNGSGLNRVEIGYDLQQPPVDDGIDVSGLASNYEIKDGKVRIDFTVSAQGKYSVNAMLYNHDGRPQANGMAVANLDDNSQTLSMEPRNLKEGHHRLVVIATPQDGGEVIQQTFDMMLHESTDPVDPVEPDGEYQFVFPAGLSSYTAGTKVLQPKTGKVYECQSFPNSGYCKQWTTGATQFEPGVGSHWKMAWNEVK